MALLFEKIKEEIKQELKQELKEELLREKTTANRAVKQNNTEKLNERVKRYRKSRGYSQAYVARKLELCLSTYSRYEANGKFPVESVLKLAELFNVSVEELLLG